MELLLDDSIQVLLRVYDRDGFAGIGCHSRQQIVR